MRILALEFKSKNKKGSSKRRRAKCPRGGTQSYGELFSSPVSVNRLILSKNQGFVPAISFYSKNIFIVFRTHIMNHIMRGLNKNLMHIC